MKRIFPLLTLSGLVALAPARAAIADHITRASVAGIDLIVDHTGIEDVVTFRGSFPGGDCLSPGENIAVATLTGGMLDKGTTTHTKFEIAQQLDAVGASLGFSVGPTMLNVSGKCLKKDLPLVVRLLAEQLRSPAFDPTELAKYKKQLIAGLKRGDEDTENRANQAFAAAIYPIGHPNYQPPTADMIAAVEAATVDDLKAFYNRVYGPAHFTLVAVGDVDPAALKSDVAQSFAGWTGGVALPAFAKAGSTDANRTQDVFMPDKTSVTVIIGQADGLKYTDPGALALRVGTAILGQGFTGRLMANTRDKEGLTYDVGAFVENDALTDGDWQLYASFAPELLDKGIASARRQLEKWAKDGVTEEELAKRKTDMIGQFKVGLSTTGGLAGAILITVQRGLDVSWLDEYPKRVAALTTADVNAAIRKYLAPENMVTVKAGTVPGGM